LVSISGRNYRSTLEPQHFRAGKNLRAKLDKSLIFKRQENRGLKNSQENGLENVNYISTKLKREKNRLENPGCLSGQCSRRALCKRTFWKDEVFCTCVPQ